MAVYNSRMKNWEDLEVTKEELDNITDCLKKEEFRKLLFEYAEEVTNPENKKLYEEEITQLEKERGVDITFVNPEPGYVIKTSVDGSKKCFINISKSSIIAKPSSQPTYENGNKGLQWSIPYTLAPPRDDLDKKNSRCVVFDVVFHPDTLHLASKNSKFRETVNQTAFDGVEKNFSVKLDRNNIKFPKINFKGISQPTVIRKKCEKRENDVDKQPLDIEPEIYQKLMSSYDESREQHLKTNEIRKPDQRPEPESKYYKEDNAKTIINGEKLKSSSYTIPKFVIKHQNNLEIEDFENHKNAKLLSAVPNKLIITIDLPLLKTAEDATLDVQERLLFIKSDKPAKYQLQLPLPYSVDPDNGNAKFDSKSKKLTVTLPVIRGVVPLRIPQSKNHSKEDSGVDSDHGLSPFNSFTNENEEPLVQNHQNNDNKDHESEFSECEDTALRTNADKNDENEEKEEENDEKLFLNPQIRYSLPQFTCNLYDNTLALTIHLKNVDPASLRTRTLTQNSGIHALLTSVGAGFFPLYYSLCIKTGDDSIIPESLTVEPWDNNVVFTISLNSNYPLVNYSFGLNEDIMEVKEFSDSISLRNKINKLMIHPESETEKKIEVIAEGDDMVINVTSNNQLDSDDEGEGEGSYRDSSAYDDHRSISESSGDELSNNRCTAGRSKGILKCRRNYGGFTRSVSESSVDDSVMLASSIDFHSDSIPEIYSESGSSSLKKTVRFNDVVARQLYRSNSSILGQRKKNQRKLRNKKRAHDRRTSESENSESEDRAEKYKVLSQSGNSKDRREESYQDYNNENVNNVKPILNQSNHHKKSQHIDIDNQYNNYNSRTNKSRNSNGDDNTERNSSWDNNDGNRDNDSNIVVKEIFKNDLIFDLDI